MIAFALAIHLAAAPVAAESHPESSPPDSGASAMLQPGLHVSPQAWPAAMSLVVPGSGQLFQGQLEKGAWHLAASAALWWLMAQAESQQANVTGPTSTGTNVRVMSALGLLGLAVWSPLDAWFFGEESSASEGAQARSSFLRK